MDGTHVGRVPLLPGCEQVRHEPDFCPTHHRALALDIRHGRQRRQVFESWFYIKEKPTEEGPTGEGPGEEGRKAMSLNAPPATAATRLAAATVAAAGGAAPADLTATAFVRPRFFAGQLLTEDDLGLLTTYTLLGTGCTTGICSAPGRLRLWVS